MVALLALGLRSIGTFEFSPEFKLIGLAIELTFKSKRKVLIPLEK